MTPERLAEHWQQLRECEAEGRSRPRVYRELIETATEDRLVIAELRAYIEELEVELRSLREISPDDLLEGES